MARVGILGVCAWLLAAAAPAQRVDPPAAVVALLDAGPPADATWAATLAQAAGTPDGLVRALTALQPGSEATQRFGANWGERQRVAIHAALATSARSARARAFETVASEGRAGALATLEGVARHGTLEDLGAIRVALDQLARNSSRRARTGLALTPLESRAVGTALVSFVREDRLRVDAIAAALPSYEPESRAAVLRGLASAPGPSAFELARRALCADAPDDTVTPALVVLTVSARAVSPLERAAAAPAARRHLVAPDAGRIAAAIGAARALGDVDAVPTLVVLLERRRDGLEERASEALADLTGRRGDGRVATWQAWLHQEERWHAASHLLAGALAAGADDHALGAVREVAARTLFRRERARLLELALEHSAPRVRRVAAEALGALPGEATLAALARHAESDLDPSVRDAARAALARHTTPGPN